MTTAPTTAADLTAPPSLSTLAQLARIVDSRAGSMLIGVGIVLVLWQFIAGPEIRANREANTKALADIAAQLNTAAFTLNEASKRLERTP